MKIKMKLLLSFLVLFIALPGFSAETPGVVQLNSCNLAEGKTGKDVDNAITFWQEQMATLGGGDYFGAILTPVISSLPADFIWLGATPNMNAWASGGAAYAASKEGQAANARLAKVGSCSASLNYSTQVYMGMPANPDDSNGFIEGYGCTLKDGKTGANVRALEENYTAAVKELGVPMNVFRFNPIVSNGEIDLIYLAVHDDRAAFGANTTAIGTNPTALAAFQNFAQVMDCGSSLFSSRIIHRPTPAAE